MLTARTDTGLSFRYKVWRFIRRIYTFVQIAVIWNFMRKQDSICKKLKRSSEKLEIKVNLEKCY